MHRKVNLYLSIIFALLFSSSVLSEPSTPPLLLAKVYSPEININDYWVSEKLDGVRAYWDGTNLSSRKGNIIKAPNSFIAALPEIALDGELWSGRNQFDTLSGIVRRKNPSPKDWSSVKYMLFDMPHSKDKFDQRLLQLKQLVTKLNAPHIQMVDQYKLNSTQALQQKLQQIIKKGGEGLMLHKADSLYQQGRSNDLLKLKLYQDAEAIVTGHTPGKGQFTGLLGALIVKTTAGKSFRLGTGFSITQRKNPPPIGTIITYKYFGLTSSGLPRFASFLRRRIDP